MVNYLNQTVCNQSSLYSFDLVTVDKFLAKFKKVTCILTHTLLILYSYKIPITVKTNVLTIFATDSILLQTKTKSLQT